MKTLNKEMVDKLAKGEVNISYSGESTLLLNQILKSAFPNDDGPEAEGVSTVYGLWNYRKDHWEGKEASCLEKPGYPISSFFITDEKEVKVKRELTTEDFENAIAFADKYVADSHPSIKKVEWDACHEGYCTALASEEINKLKEQNEQLREVIEKIYKNCTGDAAGWNKSLSVIAKIIQNNAALSSTKQHQHG